MIILNNRLHYDISIHVYKVHFPYSFSANFLPSLPLLVISFIFSSNPCKLLCLFYVSQWVFLGRLPYACVREVFTGAGTSHLWLHCLKFLKKALSPSNYQQMHQRQPSLWVQGQPTLHSDFQVTQGLRASSRIIISHMPCLYQNRGTVEGPAPPHLMCFSRLSVTASYGVVSMFTLICALSFSMPSKWSLFNGREHQMIFQIPGFGGSYKQETYVLDIQ